MVFALEEMVNIEGDRNIGVDSTVETHEFVADRTFNNCGYLTRIIDKILTNYLDVVKQNEWGVSHFDVTDVFAEAFYNAGRYGNQDVIGKKIKVTIKYSSVGGVIYVEDEGEGFDFRTQITKIEKGERHEHHHFGTGMKKLHSSKLSISYHRTGNIISIATPLPPSGN